MKKVVVITGGDSNFFGFMAEALESLFALNIERRADFGILDLGLSSLEVNALQALGCAVRKPEWTLPVPKQSRLSHEVGLIARTALRDYFPGFQVYLWFDADAWAQTPEFFQLFVDGAKAKGAAVVREDGPGVRRDSVYKRWWYGHMIASYGLLKGIKIAIRPAINIGVVALSDTAPHWQAWINHYTNMILARNKINLDQHAFNAALELGRLPRAAIPARCNWICTLSQPVWDGQRKLMCEPSRAAAPLSVLHLAGPEKSRPYTLAQTSRGKLTTALTYSAVQGIRGD